MHLAHVVTHRCRRVQLVCLARFPLFLPSATARLCHWQVSQGGFLQFEDTIFKIQDMIPRHLAKHILQATEAYPVITLMGPRQSGKTTLVRQLFAGHAYVSLEAPDHRAFALEDPRGFLGQFAGGVILDEVQRAPDLLSYIQGIVDEQQQPGQFVLTGSQNFLLLEKVTQSLAGRTALFHLLPFSHSELMGRPPLPLEHIGAALPEHASQPSTGTPESSSLFETLFTGFYPRIHDLKLAPQDWLRNYFQTYIERDVRTLLNVGNVETFTRFVRLCAGRSGQLLKISALGADCGISHDTARRWLSVLEASYVVHLLRPHHRNFNKRLIKSPKLYFLDSGLLCFLLRVQSPEMLVTHPLRGAIFESFAVAELLKTYHHTAREPNLYFWRSADGHEVDVLLERGQTLVPLELKSGETIASDFFKGLRYWRSLPGQAEAPAALVHGGTESRMQQGVAVYSWRDWG